MLTEVSNQSPIATIGGIVILTNDDLPVDKVVKLTTCPVHIGPPPGVIEWSGWRVWQSGDSVNGLMMHPDMLVELMKVVPCVPRDSG